MAECTSAVDKLHSPAGRNYRGGPWPSASLLRASVWGHFHFGAPAFERYRTLPLIHLAEAPREQRVPAGFRITCIWMNCYMPFASNDLQCFPWLVPSAGGRRCATPHRLVVYHYGRLLHPGRPAQAMRPWLQRERGRECTHTRGRAMGREEDCRRNHGGVLFC